MRCPKCGEEILQQESCPLCGAVLAEVISGAASEDAVNIAEAPAAVEETEAVLEEAEAEIEAETEVQPEPEVETEATASESEEAGAPDAQAENEEASQQEAVPQKKKKSPLGIVAGIVIVLLVVIVVCLTLALKTVSDGGSLPSLSEKLSDWKTERADAKFDPEAIGITVTDASGNTASELNNEQLAFYYWGEYYYFVNNNGFVFDASMRLDEQIYDSVTDSETGETTVTTWHQYFLESACYAINQTESLKAEAEAAGFTMPEEYQTEYDDILANMATNAASAGFTDADGNGNALAYIQDSYGPNTTLESFEAYLYDSYYTAAYSDQVYYGFEYDDEAIEAHFDENADTFTAYGIEKLDTPNVNVRHILIEPETDEEGTVTDEAWEAAREEAERIYQEWLDGNATEESFGELATTYTADSGSSSTGGLYDNVYPGEMVTEFNDWCFDADRQPGDTDIVKTSYGYHIMYFVSQTDEYYWKTVAESDLRYTDGTTYLENLALSYTTSVTEAADIQYPDAVKIIMGNSNAVE